MRVRVLDAASLVFLALGFFASGGDAADTETLWELEVDTPGQPAYAHDLRVVGSRVVLTGRTGGVFDGDFLAAALQRRKGRLQWSVADDWVGGADLGFRVIPGGRRVFCAGRVEEVADHDRWIVRAHDVRKGTLLWEDVFDHGGEGGVAFDGLVLGKRLVVLGYAEPDDGVPDAVVRSYDTRTGRLRWSDVHDWGGGRSYAQQIAHSRGRLVYVGYTYGNPPQYDVVVRALDLATGAPLWDRRIDRAGEWDLGASVHIAGRTVVIAAAMQDAAEDFDMVVRAFALNDGSDLWEDVYDTGTEDRGQRMVARGKTAWVMGWTEDADGKRNALVRAYSVKDGAVLWTHLIDHPQDSIIGDHIVLAGEHPVVACRASEPGGDVDIVLRALHGRTGKVLIDERIDRVDGSDGPGGLAAKGRTIYLASSPAPDGGLARLTISAHKMPKR